ncbi:hypothetical protein QBC35DRAFT_257040 [Podospora australis]|uniref:Carrier domain-containing protein n=1 Tax=Podospora australis TaxID=1536484 RepID=A0AAN7AHC7_9PEZI|nr:hypothetical protein QBC35DRAFT_257040 [Podospora australis]
MAHLTADHLQHLYKTFGDLKVLDDIIRHRAADDPPSHILGYPRTDDSVDDYEHFTGKQLDAFIDGACKRYMSLGLKSNTREVVALLAPSNVDFIVSWFALSRLGYTVLCLSLRIAPVAITNLLRQTDCHHIVHGPSPQILSSIKTVSAEWPLNTFPIPTRSIYSSFGADQPKFYRKFNREEETFNTALIMHSSGSTGLPKPVRLSHKAVLTHAVQGAGVNNFGALPLYHMYGVSTTLQAMYQAKTANLFNTALPLTADGLIAAIEAVRPEAVHAVPYALGLLAEKEKGVEYLRRCKFVTAAGARTPDELGDRLVEEGVELAVVFGTTEAGLLGDTMRRKKGDTSWNYIRIYAYHRQFIYMDPLGDNQFEAIYLKGHPGLSTSNSDYPAPGSWRSKDVFTPHPTLPDVWKYVTRLDDRVTLVNGEKVLPLPIEGRLREDPLIREAVVFGVDKPIPGLLVFRVSDDLSDEEYINAIWPSVADANTRAEAFSQITRDMVVLVESSVEYPRTDKGSIIRAQVYKNFADKIEEAYDRLDGDKEGSLSLDLPQIEEFILTTLQETIGVSLASVDTDFFTAGIDSLKAIQMRRILQKTLNLNGQSLTPNVVYEKRNTRGLAKHLYSLSKGAEVAGEEENTTNLMKEFVEKYSSFSETVLLTGATGSLGAHTLHQLSQAHHIKHIYCLVRPSSSEQNPMSRITKALTEKGLSLPAASLSKITALSSDLSKPEFGLSPTVFEQVKNTVTWIIHSAWSVNFNLPLASFEPDIQGLYNLLRLSLSVHRAEPAKLFFCSSVSTAFATLPPAGSISKEVVIPNEPVDVHQAAGMGYAQSKWVGEQMCLRASQEAGARAYVLRIGQIVGDKTKGIWNDVEAVPTLIRTGLVMGCLPDLEFKGEISWLPVDTLATTILQLSQTLSSAPRPTSSSSVFYNLVNPQTFTWSALIHTLREQCGWKFSVVPVAEWFSRLQEETDSVANPAVKLVDFYREEYGTEDTTLVSFDMSSAQRDASALRGGNAPRIIEDGFVTKFVDAWVGKWGVASAAVTNKKSEGEGGAAVAKGLKQVNGAVNGTGTSTATRKGHATNSELVNGVTTGFATRQGVAVR